MAVAGFVRVTGDCTRLGQGVGRTMASTPPWEAAPDPSASLDFWPPWKREGKADRYRYREPYVHEVCVNEEASSDGGQRNVALRIEQRAFTTAGFASTVWDSAIVVAAYLERHQAWYAQRRGSVELGAGCGLPSCVLSALGMPDVVGTDLAEKLPLLRSNLDAAAEAAEAAGARGVQPASAMELHWAKPESCARLLAALGGRSPDLIVCCDTMYGSGFLHEQVETLAALCGRATECLVAYGNNRQGEEAFTAAAEAHGFSIEAVPAHQLAPSFRPSDVTVLRLRRVEG